MSAMTATYCVPAFKGQERRMYGVNPDGLWYFDEAPCLWYRVLTWPNGVVIDGDVPLTHSRRGTSPDDYNVLVMMAGKAVWEFDRNVFQRSKGVAA